MVNEKIGCAFVLALALAGVPACGGQSNDPPPQTPAAATTTTSGPATATMQDNMPGQTAATPGFNASSGGTTPTDNAAAGNAGSESPASTTAGATLNQGNDPRSGIGAGASAGASAGARGGPSDPTPLSEGQIVAVLQAANEGEVAQAREAIRKGKNPKVKQFAQHMVLDHTQADSKIASVDKKTGITPATSPVTDQLKLNGEQIMVNLKSASGGDFDKAYMDAQVDEHNKVLDLLDNKLIPGAQNGELLKTLQDIRSKVASHLTMAQGIQSSLGQ